MIMCIILLNYVFYYLTLIFTTRNALQTHCYKYFEIYKKLGILKEQKDSLNNFIIIIIIIYLTFDTKPLK